MPGGWHIPAPSPIAVLDKLNGKGAGMPITVAMYDKGLGHIGERLKALGLDIKVVTFSKDGMFLIDGARVAPADVAVDYLWLNSNINLDGFQQGAFDIALACRSVGVLQTFNAGLDHPFYKKEACGADAEGELDRAEFGMKQYTEDGAGTIRLRIQVEAVKED